MLTVVALSLFMMNLTAQSNVTKWTFLVYLIGSDLESGGGAGSSDLREMMAVGSNLNANIIVTTGGANKDNSTQPGGINWRKINRWMIEKGKMKSIPYTPASNDMATVKNLTDFITWGQASYPADKYALILWDHGGAIDGFGHDEVSKNMFKVMQIKDAMEKAYTITKKRFEVLGFDACLMANIEVLANFKTFSNYFVASEELEPGHGWNYTPILSAMTSGSIKDGAALGKVIADGFLAQAMAEQTKGITLSVTDNSKTDAVLTALDEFVQSLSVTSRKTGAIKYLAVSKGRSQTEEYGKSSREPSESVDVIDIVDFAKNVKKEEPSVSVKADALIAAIQKAVVYHVKDKTNPNASGLTVFLPFNKLDKKEKIANVVAEYNKINFSETYKNFVQNFIDDALADGTSPEVPNGVTEEDNLIEAVCTSDDYDEAYVVLMTPDTEDDDIINFLGVMLPDDVIYTDQGVDIQYQWDGQWVGLNGVPASIADMYNTEFEADNGDLIPVTIVEIPVLLNGEVVTLQFTIDEEGVFILNDILPEIDDEGLFPKETITIEEGDEITLLYEQYNTVTDESNWLEGDTFTIDSEDDLELSMIDLPKGQYLIGYSITDLHQNEEFFMNENIFTID